MTPCDYICFFKFPFYRKLFWQIPQMKGFSFVWTHKWSNKFHFFVNLNLHQGHSHFSIVFILEYKMRLPLSISGFCFYDFEEIRRWGTVKIGNQCLLVLLLETVFDVLSKRRLFLRLSYCRWLIVLVFVYVTWSVDWWRTTYLFIIIKIANAIILTNYSSHGLYKLICDIKSVAIAVILLIIWIHSNSTIFLLNIISNLLSYLSLGKFWIFKRRRKSVSQIYSIIRGLSIIEHYEFGDKYRTFE